MPVGARHNVSADTVQLSDGRSFALATIPGRTWDAQRLELVRQALLTLTDERVPRSTLSDEDPDKTRTQEELTERYGKRVILDGDDLIIRPVDHEVSWTDDRLWIRSVDIGYVRD